MVPASRRVRVERRGYRPHGPGALPLPVPVLRGGDRLSCQLYQRSADVFLGVPFNIASYSLLTHMVAQACGLRPTSSCTPSGTRTSTPTISPQVETQLTREPRALPRLPLNPAVKDIFDFTFEDIAIEGYQPHPPLRGAIAV